MTVRLPVRLFASYAVVIAVGVVTAYLTVRLLVPPLFDHQMGRMGPGYRGGSGMGHRSGGGSATPHSALISALNTALLVGGLASAAAGGLVAAFVTGRLLRPLTAVRAATRRIAAGDYAASVPPPREPELAALATDVTTLARTLADTETRRTRLLGDVAHEMRTPLTALNGYVEGLLDGVFTATPDHLQAMSEELRRLYRLADDLSTLSRTEERRLDLRPIDADLTWIAGRACERLRPQFDDAGVTLTLRGDTPVPVHVDVDRIIQVLTNLVGNALLVTPVGGAVTVAAESAGDQAVATVTDTGVGLPAADRERIFERFYRAPSRPRLRRSAGSGVGLTIARGLARAHGGDLRADSPGPGRGATFTLTLPRAQPALREPPDAAYRHHTRSSGRRSA